MNFFKSSVFTLCILLFSILVYPQDCSIRNKSFKPGEKLEYDIYYYLAGIWLSAAEVEFNVTEFEKNNKSYLQYYALGKTLPKYDWFYRVRDTYAAIVEKESLLPLFFQRKVNEGSTYIREKYYFNSDSKSAITKRQMHADEPVHTDTVSYSGCSWDVLSIIYYARNLDFSKSKVGDKLPIKIFLDNQEHQSHIEFLGKEELQWNEKKIMCYKFSPLLIEGTIFESGKGMTVWVSADQNMLPLLIETPILVGSIKVKLRSAVNLANKAEAKQTKFKIDAN